MTAQQARQEHLLTPAQVAALVFVHPKTVSRWARAGKIPSTRTPGGHRRFRSSDVRALMPLPHTGAQRGGTPDAHGTGRAAADAGHADTVAPALEARSAAAAEAVLESASRVAIAADMAASASVRTRRARALAVAEAARVSAGQAAGGDG